MTLLLTMALAQTTGPPLDLAPPAETFLFPFEAPIDDPVRVGFVCTGERLRVCRHPESGRPVSFSLVDTGPSTIVPTDRGRRTWHAEFFQRTRRDVRLRVYECARCDARDSHVSMVTSLHVFPRRGLPTLIERPGHVELRLPTGEPVCFDPETHVITGGVLEERAPMDTAKNRFRRAFADVAYVGSGVLLRSDQRGRSTRRRGKATLTWGDETCRVRRRDLWTVEEEWPTFRFPTDEGLFAFVETTCGWDLPAPDVLVPEDVSCP